MAALLPRESACSSRPAASTSDSYELTWPSHARPRSSRASALVRLESEFTFHLDAAIDEFPEHAPLYEIGLYFYSHVVNPAAALALDKSWRGKV
ncbi:hypothetical protein DIPPA_08094 [Diplonema papillatum]|nr:hypothetical protein DIPPA_08094 [Diplonema papillatum]